MPLLLLALTAILPGCRPANSPVDTNATQGSPAATDATAAAAKPTDEITIPEGTPEELFQFLQELETRTMGMVQDAAATDPEARATAIRRLMSARVRACDKILATEIPPETRASAVQMKLDALRTLVALEPAQWKEAFTNYSQQLLDGTDPLLGRLARLSRFHAQVNEALSSGKDDTAAIRTSLAELLQDPAAGPETFRAARDATGWLLDDGQADAAIELMVMIGNRFQNYGDQNLAAEAAAMLNQTTYIRLTQQARRVLEEQPGAIEKLTGTIQELLSAGSADQNLLAYTMQTAQLLEFAGHTAAARQTYDLILQHYQAQPDKQTAEDVQRTVALAHRRLGLVGQPLQLDGVLLDGSVFDWQSYRGKDVLLCFWTTWYENWLKDVEQIQQVAGDYRANGLEIVTINLDDNRNLLERFLQTHPSPWPVVVNPDPTAAGFENENAVRCGVEAVPFALLVNRQGIVTDLHLLGRRLKTTLEQRLGPAPAASAPQP